MTPLSNIHTMTKTINDVDLFGLILSSFCPNDWSLLNLITERNPKVEIDKYVPQLVNICVNVSDSIKFNNDFEKYDNETNDVYFPKLVYRKICSDSEMIFINVSNEVFWTKYNTGIEYQSSWVLSKEFTQDVTIDRYLQCINRACLTITSKLHSQIQQLKHWYRIPRKDPLAESYLIDQFFEPGETKMLNDVNDIIKSRMNNN